WPLLHHLRRADFRRRHRVDFRRREVAKLPGHDHPDRDRLGRDHLDQGGRGQGGRGRSEEHTSELQSQSKLVCRLLLEKKKSPCSCPLPSRTSSSRSSRCSSYPSPRLSTSGWFSCWTSRSSTHLSAPCLRSLCFWSSLF